MATDNIEIKEVQHRGQQVLLILFPYDEKLIEKAKELNAKFTITHRGWWLPNTKENKDKINQRFKLKHQAEAVENAEASLAAPKNIELPQEYIDTLHRRRYSPNTVKTYLNFFTQFVAHIQPKPVREAEEADIKAFLLYLVKERKLGYSSQNQAVNAIKFYFEQVLHEERKTYWIDRPIKDKKLPQVLSEEEVAQMLTSCKNLKHWLVVAMLYAAGLRRSELLNLRKQDVQLDRRQLFIRGAKGNKDRLGLLSDLLIEQIPVYLAEYKPVYWLIESPNKKQYSATSIAKVVDKAAKGLAFSEK